MWPLLLNRYVIGAAAGFLCLLGAYGYGYSTASKACRADAIQSELDAAKRDLKAAQDAALIAEAVADANATLSKELQGDVERYKAELAQRKNPARALTSRDADQLRCLSEGSCRSSTPPKPLRDGARSGPAHP